MKLRLLALAACLLAALTAASGAADSRPLASKHRASATTLTFWFWGDLDAPGANAWLARAVKAYEAKHPSIAIKVVEQPTASFVANFVTAATAKTGPDIAAQWATGPVLTQAWHGAITPISDLVPASEIRHWRNTAENTYKGKVWAMPVYLIGIPWVYNKALFVKAGLDPKRPPQSWASLIRACGKLQAAGITPVAFGNDAAWSTQLMIQGMNSLQQLVDASTGKAHFTDKAHAGFEGALKQMVDAKCFNADANSIPWSKALDSFSAGKAAMTLTTDGGVQQAKKALGASKVDVMRWPIWGTGKLKDAYDATQSTSYFVTSWSKHKREAAAFLVFLHTPAEITDWFKTTGVPPADNRFSISRVTDPLEKKLYRFDTTGPQIWVENFVPSQVDIDGDGPAQQLLLGGGDPAAAAQLRERSASAWRLQHSADLKFWKAWKPASTLAK
jgi:ABC-type glycerol-3-phosphate transport system substrate-binding protein